MQQFFEPFVSEPIASSTVQDDVTSYYNGVGKLLAEAHFHEGAFYAVTFFGTNQEITKITEQQAKQIVQKVQTVFQQEQLVVESFEQVNNKFFVVLQLHEPIYNVAIPSTIMTVTISQSGFVEEISLNEKDMTIHYPDQLIAKEEARAILQQQPLLKLSIAPEVGWQYVYEQNYDLFGVSPNGEIRLLSDEDVMQGASFDPLPEVEEIADLEQFLTGGRQATVEVTSADGEKSWVIESEDYIELEEDVFLRACKVVKHLVGEQYGNYYFEQYPHLMDLFKVEGGASLTLRFVYKYNDITLDFHAISIFVNTDSNQIQSVKLPFIPYDTFPTLPEPKLSISEANEIAKQLIDVDLTVIRNLDDSKCFSFLYCSNYPTSPTGGHIQYVDAFTGEIHWIETGW